MVWLEPLVSGTGNIPHLLNPVFLNNAASAASEYVRVMSAVELFHDRLATTVLLFFLAAGLWGLIEFARGGVLSGSIAGALIVGQIIVLVQGALGMVLYIWGDRPSDSVHLLYGFTAALVLPFVWSYVRNRAPRQGLLFYSLVSLFIFGLAIRGMTTGS